MSDYLRPEARAFLWRWRDVWIALALGAFGLRSGLWSFGILQWLGWAMVAAALAFLVSGIQRARFRKGSGGSGVVQVDERRLSYFGPVTGGVISAEEISRVVLGPAPEGGNEWRFATLGGERLHIPVNAEGSDALFDLFATLPGLRTQAMIDALDKPLDEVVEIWRR